MISSSGTSYRKKWNSSSAVAELAFRLSVICTRILLKNKITYKKVNDCKLKLYYNNKKIFTVTRQFDNFENMENWLNNLE